VYLASQQAMNASAWAVFSAENRRLVRGVDQPASRTKSMAIRFQCPGGVTVPGPSAQKSAIRLCSSVNVCDTAYTSFSSAVNQALP
jgi:hypothetical protein